MAISAAQFEIWSHQGTVTGSSTTYNTVKDVLEAAGTPYADKKFSVFLQGSYGNDTNIYAESDVDVVICLNDCFQSDRSTLSAEEEAAWKKTHNDASYTHVNFKKDVLKVLTDSFGDDVKVGQKAILIEAHGKRRKTDVIAAIQYRRYFKFNGINDQSYQEGICFYTSDGTKIANYPKLHKEHLTTKHQDTSKWLKPMIRIMKNLRTQLVDDGLLDEGLAPSYFIEGLLYNVPNDNFHTDYETCFINAYNWIQSKADKSKLLCANKQYYLIRDGHSVCWPTANCDAYLDAIKKKWNE